MMTPSEKNDNSETLQADWSQADASNRRRLIVDQALVLLNSEGLEAVTMRRVASELNVGAMTLYTYVRGQQDLYQAIVERGFEMMSESCCASSTLNTPLHWRGGAAAYLRFAIAHPNLYRLMFDTPLPEGQGDLLAAGFSGLLAKVRTRLAEHGISEDRLDAEAMKEAGRYWIALHGLASLAIAQRLGVLGQDIDQLLDDLLEHVSPT